MENLVKSMIKDKSITLELLRVYLGFALLIKGIYFISHMTEVFQVISFKFGYLDFLLSHLVVLAHIVGGAFLILGLYTRIACAVNVPILLSAVILSQDSVGKFNTRSDFELAMLVFVLLLYFIVNGSGKLSLDEYIKKHEIEH